ncbi:hypothetical protein FACS189485_11360 [Spirochaetia bacterium]|nr:hypothetical protein FACS189485_11360 [Spirochaetia bacterium]
MKRSVLIVLVTLFTVSALFAGGGGQTAPAAQTGKPTITIGSAWLYNTDWPTWDVYQDLADRVGVKLDYTFYDKDRLALVLASNNLPDIVIGNPTVLSSVVNNKLAMKLDPILDQYIPNAKLPMYKTRNDLLRLFAGGSDNGLYIISPGIGPENGGGTDSSPRGYSVRWDYYKEIGAPPIRNDDDFVAVLKAMIDRHPTTADGRKTYAIANENTWARFHTQGMVTARLNPWTLLNSEYMGGFDDDEVYNGYTNLNRSAFWNQMKLYNKLNRLGIFDQDSFTMTADDLNAKTDAGVYMSSVLRNDRMYNEMRKKDPNTLAGHMLVPSEGAVVFANKPLLMGNAPDQYVFISANSKNWEKAAQVLNILHDPDFIREQHSGFKGKYWDYDAAGKPYITDLGFSDYNGNTPAYVQSGVSFYSSLMMADYTATHPDGSFFGLFRGKEYQTKNQLSPLYQDYANFYKVARPADITMDYVRQGKTIDMRNDYVQVIAVGLANVPSDIERIINSLNDLCYRATPRLIEAKTDAEFTQIQQRLLADLKAAGEPTAWEWVRTNYNKYKAQVDPIFREYNSRQKYE